MVSIYSCGRGWDVYELQALFRGSFYLEIFSVEYVASSIWVWTWFHFYTLLGFLSPASKSLLLVSMLFSIFGWLAKLPSGCFGFDSGVCVSWPLLAVRQSSTSSYYYSTCWLPFQEGRNISIRNKIKHRSHFYGSQIFHNPIMPLNLCKWLQFRINSSKWSSFRQIVVFMTLKWLQASLCYLLRTAFCSSYSSDRMLSLQKDRYLQLIRVSMHCISVQVYFMILFFRNFVTAWYKLSGRS